MPAALLLDKSYLDAASRELIATLCRDHSVMCSETLFYELMTTNPKSQIRCFSKLPGHPGSFALLPNVGTLLRTEMEKQAPCGPLDRHVIEGSYVFNPKLRTGTYVAKGEVLEALQSWRNQVDQDAREFLERCQSVHEFFPELIGIEFRDFPAAVKAARTKVAENPGIVRAVYASFTLPPKAPSAAEIGPDWAWFRWVQCQLLAALRIFGRYQGKVPTDPTPGVLERAEVSGKPAALYPTSIRVGTISSMFNTMEIGHGWDGRKTIA